MGEEGDHELFAHITPDDGDINTPGLGFEAALNHPLVTVDIVDSQYRVDRYQSGAEVLAIDHDNSPDPEYSPDFNQYNETDTIAEANEELEVSKGTSPAKSAKELTQDE